MGRESENWQFSTNFKLFKFPINDERQIGFSTKSIYGPATDKLSSVFKTFIKTMDS